MMANETNGRPRPSLAFRILGPVTTDRFSLLDRTGDIRKQSACKGKIN